VPKLVTTDGQFGIFLTKPPMWYYLCIFPKSNFTVLGSLQWTISVIPDVYRSFQKAWWAHLKSTYWTQGELRMANATAVRYRNYSCGVSVAPPRVLNSIWLFGTFHQPALRRPIRWVSDTESVVLTLTDVWRCNMIPKYCIPQGYMVK
jgi:hypothetical protein